MNRNSQICYDLGESRAKELNGRTYPALGYTLEGDPVIIHADMAYTERLRIPMDKAAYWQGFKKQEELITARKGK
jgi:hypothetical protein